MVGLFIGSFVFGFISDKFGRKIAMLGCILVSSSASLAGSFMTDYWSYMALRLVTASGSVGLFNEAFTMTVELMGSKEVNTQHSTLNTKHSTLNIHCKPINYFLYCSSAPAVYAAAPSSS